MSSMKNYLFCQKFKVFFFRFTVAAAVYTEQLFKNSTKGESFLDQQFWLYFYGTLVASTVHFLSAPHYTFRSLIKDVLGEYFTFSWNSHCIQILIGYLIFRLKWANFGAICCGCVIYLYWWHCYSLNTQIFGQYC